MLLGRKTGKAFCKDVFFEMKSGFISNRRILNKKEEL